MNLFKKLADERRQLQERITAIEAELEGRPYLYIASYGEIETEKYDTRSGFSILRSTFGNSFLVDHKKQLSSHVKRMRLFNELMQIALEIDTMKSGRHFIDEPNFCIGSGPNAVLIQDTALNTGAVYFSTRVIASEAWGKLSKESQNFLLSGS